MLGENIDKLVKATEDEKVFFIDSTVWEVSACSLSFRKASATADIDKALAGERPCFLCENARPKEQKHIIWEGYDILANPYPLSVLHLTIAAREHTPQLIAPHIHDMARLTRLLPDHAIFYNGPRCGASAPDHMHFQAVDKRLMYNFTSRRDMLMPMVNILAWKEKKGTSVVIIPRKAHRPACYGTGEDGMLISPATLEMAGFFTCARPEDVDKLNAETVQQIYDDVCLSGDNMDPIYEKLK